MKDYASQLERARSAQAAIDAARVELREAVAAAHTAGASLAVVGSALGVSRQRAHKLLTEARSQEPEASSDRDALVARLAELDGRWNSLVDRLTPAFVRPDAKRDQAKRNAVAKKRARKGLPPLRTVTAEARVFAEEHVLKYIEDHPLLPVCQVAGRELVEADAIRERLAALADDVLDRI